MPFSTILKQIRLELTYQKFQTYFAEYMQNLHKQFADGKIGLCAYLHRGRFMAFVAETVSKLV